MDNEKLKDFDKNQLSNKFNSVITQINNLKVLIEIPSMYINNYFIDIRNEIDLAVTEKQIKENGHLDENLNKNWIQMIDLLYAFETECLARLKSKKLFYDIEKNGKDFIQSIDLKLSKLEKEVYQETTHETAAELEKLENEVYDETFKFEKIVFMNRTVVYLDKNNSKLENYFENMNPKTTIGKLVVVKNEYFGKRGLILLKDSKYSNKDITKRLTNECIKSDRVKELLQETNSANQIDEICSDDKIFEINFHYVKTIDAMAFHDLIQITQIDLSDNELKEINSNVLHSLVNLTLLDLSHNELGEISPDLLRGLINLTEIYLHGNRIKEINPNFFRGLTQLAVVSLHDNQICKLDANLFNDLSNLASINLSFNLLREIDPKLFQGLSNLSYIDLSMNLLTSLDSELINGLTNLDRIFTFDNQLTNIAPNLLDYIQDFI